jgi:hypothetical protein
MGGKLGRLFARAGHEVVFSKVIVSCSLPMNAENTGLVVAHTAVWEIGECSRL